MTQHMHFDEEKIKAAIEQFAAVRRPHLDAPGFPGAQARFAEAVMPGYQLAFCREVNRGTGPEDVTAAIAILLANIATNWLATVSEDDSTIEDKAEIMNVLMTRFEVYLSRAVNELQCDRGVIHVAGEIGGRA